ncbi:helix-turn-helix domain-containing protein [Xenorhabdus nematophila]|uniref:helix-turn-helix domain-containing protein n=1 Tax=Xenorhabdus nematophila TaxID=628 RepID=UPI0009DDD24E|nr:helix-turn-helix transcriptional regulator [Xenorhabdus nematophila]
MKKRLSESRKALGLSQRELGEKLGLYDEDVAKATISRYERGLNAPAYSTVCQIANILKVPPCYFYIDDDIFAEQVLKLYRKNNTPLEEELMIAKERILQYENALETVLETTKNVMSQLKKRSVSSIFYG